MSTTILRQFAPALAVRSSRPRVILLGVTDSQTCMVLESRLRALRAEGFRVILVSSPGKLLDQTAARVGVERFAIPMQRRITPLADLISLFRLWQLMKRCRPDIVEFSTPKAGLLGLLVARLLCVPGRVYMLRGLKLETASGLKRAVLLAAERVAAACADVVLCNSESLRMRASELNVAPSVKLHLLGKGSSNGVDATQFSPGPSSVRELYGCPPDAPVVGFAGRLTRDKGIPELVEAFEAVLRGAPDAHLLLVGWFDNAEDALGGGIRACIENHARIHCTGFVRETAPYYRAMDVMVLPTWREGFPNVVLEAAATGVPVVTTPATGARDSVVPGVTGVLIPPGNPAAIANAVLELLADSDRCRRMGEAARAWVLEHYRDTHVLRLTTAFYAGLLDSVEMADTTLT
jgi:glycosyltransferase involved in cell wall biosynthesis